VLAITDLIARAMIVAAFRLNAKGLSYLHLHLPPRPLHPLLRLETAQQYLNQMDVNVFISGIARVISAVAALRNAKACLIES